MMQFPHLKPDNTLIPLIAEAASSPSDRSAKIIHDAIGARFSRHLANRWENMHPARRNRLLSSRTPIARSSAPFENRLWDEARAYELKRAEMARARTNRIRTEVKRALQMGIYGYRPSNDILDQPALMYEVSRAIIDKISPQNCCICCCEDPSGPETGKGGDEPSSPDAPSPTRQPKYGVKIGRAKCHNTEDNLGSDGIYALTTAVDGNGNQVIKTSNKFSINDGKNVVMNHWVYPFQDPDGKLDVAVRLYEDDGGYDDVASAVAKLGGAISTIPDPSGTSQAAGVLLGVAGGLIGLASKLDEDDDLGLQLRDWSGQPQLDGALGVHDLKYYDGDDGWRDFTDWEYHLSLHVMKA